MPASAAPQVRSVCTANRSSWMFPLNPGTDIAVSDGQRIRRFKRFLALARVRDKQRGASRHAARRGYAQGRQIDRSSQGERPSAHLAGHVQYLSRESGHYQESFADGSYLAGDRARERLRREAGYQSAPATARSLLEWWFRTDHLIPRTGGRHAEPVPLLFCAARGRRTDSSSSRHSCACLP